MWVLRTTTLAVRSSRIPVCAASRIEGIHHSGVPGGTSTRTRVSMHNDEEQLLHA